jgi:hypothetical protein
MCSQQGKLSCCLQDWPAGAKAMEVDESGQRVKTVQIKMIKSKAKIDLTAEVSCL